METVPVGREILHYLDENYIEPVIIKDMKEKEESPVSP
jgi:hypothetical protein